MSVKVTL